MHAHLHLSLFDSPHDGPPDRSEHPCHRYFGAVPVYPQSLSPGEQHYDCLSL